MKFPVDSTDREQGSARKQVHAVLREVSAPSADQDCPEYDAPKKDESADLLSACGCIPKTVLLVERHPIAPLLEFVFDIVEMR